MLSRVAAHALVVAALGRLTWAATHEGVAADCYIEDRTGACLLQTRAERKSFLQVVTPCIPAQGNNNPVYSYPVEDPTACECTNWNPDNASHECSQHHVIPGAPWGLAFLGMSFSQANPHIPTANRASVTHQTKFDLNRLQDRGNEYMCKYNDDGWLGGGGNAPSSFVLPNIDSTHAEIIHPGTICNTLARHSQVQPDTSSYMENQPEFITGMALANLVQRIRCKVSFDPIRIVPTGAVFTGSNEYQVRINPFLDDAETKPANPTLTNVYDTLVNEFIDVQVLDKSDPFHISMCRDTSFCSQKLRAKFLGMNEKLTLGPWQEWAMDTQAQDGQLGVLLNDELREYKGRAGGFYLFVTRNRPLIYFAPKADGKRSKGSRAYYVQWTQDGRRVSFADPFGGPICEKLVPIPSYMPVDKFILFRPELRKIADGLCKDFAFKAMPTTKWTPQK